MRIISGAHKGKRIIAPKKLPVRPTTDMAKEALFNILNNSFYFEDITFLDLFAGTDLTAVDLDYGCIKFIDKISTELDFGISTIKSDVFSFLGKSRLKADIIFADPPYDLTLEDFSKIPELVFKHEMLKEGGLLIIEHSKHTRLSHLEYFSNERRYGGSVFSFFKPPNS